MAYKNKEDLRIYQRNWIAARRAAFFRGKTCALCPSTEKLELDHIDPRQKVTNNVWSWKTERREEELAKCQVLCEACHLKKTIKQFSYDHPHGTEGRYKKRCRCRYCKDAHAAYARGTLTSCRESLTYIKVA